MIERYQDTDIAWIWSDGNKLSGWQATELAVDEAKVGLGMLSKATYNRISEILNDSSIDLNVWKEIEASINHDLEAFVEERRRHLPPELKRYIHEEITSYDDEEPVFARMILSSAIVFKKYLSELQETIYHLAHKYRYTVMMGRTHGQKGELQTFGKRCLTWLRALQIDQENLERSLSALKYSKISGAMGNYGNIDPRIEKEALKILGLQPFYGATQIIPRENYAPVAQALCQTVLTLSKIALDIRLGARSGRPILQEPFSKKQKGSSAMPHKKNTIRTEQIEGMARMALGFLYMIMSNILTWEERSIEQSSVERIAWPDLFHVAVHSLKSMDKVLKGLVVFRENMLLEIIDSRGTYASAQAKEFLKNFFDPEEAYRIVQLASFNAFNSGRKAKTDEGFKSLDEAVAVTEELRFRPYEQPISIREIIMEGKLSVSSELDITPETVESWNLKLKQVFDCPDCQQEWEQIFSFPHLLKNENILFEQIGLTSS
jgi:adenylosuccinate lyase